MAKKGYTPEQVINKLREAEILLQQGATIAVVSKKIGITAHTYYRWRKEYGGMRIEQAKKLKSLEKLNSIPGLQNNQAAQSRIIILTAHYLKSPLCPTYYSRQ